MSAPAATRALRSSRRSSAEIGLAYENHSLAYLNSQLHMSLRRVGRAGDGGIDLRGAWYVPEDAAPHAGPSRSSIMRGTPGGSGGGLGARRLRVVGQCKAERKPLGPRVVRELEGVVAGLHHRQRQARSVSPPSPSSLHSPSPSPPSISPAQIQGHRDPTAYTSSSPESADANSVADTDGIIAILLSQSGFSKSSMQHASRSGIPLMLVHLLGGHPHEAEASDLDSDRHSSQTLEAESEADAFAGEVESVWWNSALSGPQGILGGKVELKRELLLGASGSGGQNVRWGLWYAGSRLKRFGPPWEL